MYSSRLQIYFMKLQANFFDVIKLLLNIFLSISLSRLNRKGLFDRKLSLIKFLKCMITMWLWWVWKCNLIIKRKVETTMNTSFLAALYSYNTKQSHKPRMSHKKWTLYHQIIEKYVNKIDKNRKVEKNIVVAPYVSTINGTTFTFFSPTALWRT